MAWNDVHKEVIGYGQWNKILQGWLVRTSVSPSRMMCCWLPVSRRPALLVTTPLLLFRWAPPPRCPDLLCTVYYETCCCSMARRMPGDTLSLTVVTIRAAIS